MTLLKKNKKNQSKNDMFTSLIKTKCHGMVLKEWEERQLLEWKKKKTLNTNLFTTVVFEA